MFKLGEYCEDDARDIAEYLRDAGMKVDIRTFTEGQLEVVDYLEGRMSEIKGEIDEEEYERYARYLDTLRKVLAEGAIPENLRERFQLEIDPKVNEKRKQFCEALDGSLSEEERAAIVQSPPNLMLDLLRVANAESFIDTVLERNKIQIGEIIGDRFDDPILRISADGEEDEEENKLTRTTTVFSVEPVAEVYIDEFSAILSEEIDEDFREEYQDEYAQRALLGKLISDMTEPSSGKMDMESFSKRCELYFESDGDLLEIDCISAAEELARSLEKNGIIKMKGDSIKWKR